MPFALSFGDTVSFERFNPNVQKQTGQVTLCSGLKWNLFLDRTLQVSLHCEKIRGGPFSAECVVSSSISEQQSVTFNNVNHEIIIGTIVDANQLNNFTCSVRDVEVTDNEPDKPKLDFSVANPDLFTDVVLEVEDKEFHVNKTTLASFSTYFKNLFFREYLESTKPRIPILCVKAAGFQKLLELIYQKTDIKARNISLLLETASFFDMEDVKKLCEKAAMRMNSDELKPKKKIILAEKFALDKLMSHTLASLTTTEQVQDALPDEDLSAPTMKRLLDKLSSVRQIPPRPEIQVNQNQIRGVVGPGVYRGPRYYGGPGGYGVRQVPAPPGHPYNQNQIRQMENAPFGPGGQMRHVPGHPMRPN